MASNKSEKASLFLSYQWDDQEDVKRLRDFLKDCGFDVWMDIHNMHGGNHLPDKLAAAILEADLFICCITKKYVDSDMCKKEINYASTNKIKIIPLMFENLSNSQLQGIGLLLSGLLRIFTTIRT